MAKLVDSQRARRLMLWLDRDVVTRFDGRILPVDVAVASRWGRLVGDAAARGLTLPIIDALLAATAQQHGLSVVTRNVRDLERCGVELVNPWDLG